ncbi:hypothetical protein D6779_09370 [Candidatus Parcubacteria bacterium]|nr:MAG: hypothetical protein D6779_09370 [Candidatus Parcubacteria bacterium]
MRILFTTAERTSPSTVINAANYSRLNELDGVTIEFFNRNYADYNVILFMGYDPRVAEARAANPAAKIGVIDPRPSTLSAAQGADFVVANGVEMGDWLANYFENIYIYPIYPQVNVSPKTHTHHTPVILGYHGNKVHLMSMRPIISQALDALAKEYEVELWAVYNIDLLGKMPFDLCRARNCKVRYFQWHEGVYADVLSQVDIGIVPNLIPLKNETIAKRKAASYSRVLQPHDSDYLLRFKVSTNPGRIYVFSQLGIPVVAGMSPSAASAVQHGYSGYLAYSSGGWYWALKKLAESADLRARMGQRLREDYLARAQIDHLNRGLVDFIRQILKDDQAFGV